MKILVCISKTPDTTAKIAFKDNNTKFNEDGVQYIINPYDEWYALVRAVELKEKDPSVVIHLINVGDAANDAIIRKALAIGGDEAIRVNTSAGDDYFVAAQIAAIAQEGSYDLVLTGKETIDYNGASVGGMIAEFLQMPFISFATQFELNGTTATITREIEGGAEVNELSLPAVVSCQQGMAEQRIPNMRGIMGARIKPLKVTEPKDIAPLTEVQSFDLPAPKQGVKLFSSEQAEDLVKALREEAKVI